MLYSQCYPVLGTLGDVGNALNSFQVRCMRAGITEHEVLHADADEGGATLGTSCGVTAL